MDKKICSTCEEEKPATSDYFNKRKVGKYTNQEGLHKQCKICEAKQRKKHYEENRERLIKTTKEWQESHKERVDEYQKEYQKNNRETISAKQREWTNREENRDRIKEYRKEYGKAWRTTNKSHIKKYLENNKENTRVYSRMGSQRRNALKRNIPATLTLDQWEQIKNNFNNKCSYCGKELPLEQEHFIPLSKGGEYTRNNIIPACKSCNCSKNNKDFFEWYPNHESYSKAREKKILEFLNYTGKTQQLALAL